MASRQISNDQSPRTAVSRLSGRRSRGYVLVLTLLLLVMAATALAAVASESHRRALQAVKAQDDLQRRWGAISCQQALLPKASSLIEAAGRGRADPVGKTKLSMLLGKQKFELLISDEQAKMNLNVLARHDAARMQDAAVKLAGGNIPLALAPTKTTSKDKDGKPVESVLFASYGQIFESEVSPEVLVKGAADRITCWGDGPLNVKHASVETVMQVCSAMLTADEAEAFEKVRKKSPKKPVADILSEANVPQEKRDAIQKLLGDTSTCFSIWTVAMTQGRSTYRFAVQTSEDQDETMVFEW